MDDRTGRRPGGSKVPPAHGAVFIGLAVLTSFFAYLWGSASPNPAELLAPALFWYAVSFLLLSYPLHSAWKAFLRHVKTAFGAGVFVLYLVLHTVLYGFMLEGILVSFFGRPFSSGAFSAYVTTSVFAPATLLNALWALWFNPWVTVTVPPVFDLALSFYSMGIAVLIAILIVANIGRTRELGRACSAGLRSRAVVLLPALGIALGASCCLSIPILLVFSAPSVIPIGSSLWLYDATYFLFPPFAVALLYLNLRSVERIVSAIAQPARQARSAADAGALSPSL